MEFPDPKVRCPATGFAKSCLSIVSKHTCPKYVHIAGVNPNDNQQVNKYGCVDSFLPMLLIENAQQSRQTGAAVESLRNETVKRQDEFLSLQYTARNPLIGVLKS